MAANASPLLDVFNRPPKSLPGQPLDEKDDYDLPPKSDFASKTDCVGAEPKEIVMGEVVQPPVPPKSKTNGHKKSFEELNNPLMFAKNQEEVARKITDFRDSIIERFGSSQVPTPAVKDVYKQCGGGVESSQCKEQKQEPIENAMAFTEEPELALTSHKDQLEEEKVPECSIPVDEYAYPADKVEDNVEPDRCLSNKSAGSEGDIESSVQHLVQQVTIDKHLSSHGDQSDAEGTYQ